MQRIIKKIVRLNINTQKKCMNYLKKNTKAKQEKNI